MTVTTRRLGRVPAATPGGAISVLEARLMTLASPTASVAAPRRFDPAPLRSRHDEPRAVRRASSITRSVLSAGALLLVAATVLALSFVLDGDGTFDPPAASPREVQVVAAPQPFTVSRMDSGRVQLLGNAESLAVRVSMDPVVRTHGGWFWCIDAEPALPAAERACASGEETGLMGLLVAERVVTLDPQRGYFLQVYCQRSCEWDVVASPASGVVAAKAPRQ